MNRRGKKVVKPSSKKNRTPSQRLRGRRNQGRRDQGTQERQGMGGGGLKGDSPGKERTIRLLKRIARETLGRDNSATARKEA